MPTTQEIADDLVALCKAGDFETPGEKYWADDVLSVEASTDDMAELRGRDALKGKSQWWTTNHEIHAVEADGPYLNRDQFIVRFKMDFTRKESGERIQMDETALYTVKNGKIVEERFFYDT